MIPRVSVCVPVYNGEKYLAETLESILAQSMQDIEIIISDNASIDETPKIIAKYANYDPRIVSIRNQANIGYSLNIEKAVSKSISDIVAIFHADDLYHPQIVEKELWILDNLSEVSAVFTLPAIFTESKKMARKPSFYSNLASTKLYNKENNALVGNYDSYLPLFLEYGNIFACPSLMTRKNRFIELGGFTNKYPSNEDLELWIKYLQGGDSLAIINEFLLYYRKSNTHASSYWDSRAELAVMYQVIDELIVSKIEMSSRYIYKWKTNRAVGYARAALNAAKMQDKKKAKKLALLSRKEHLLPICNIWLLGQWVPSLFALAISIIHKCRMKNIWN